MFTLTTCGRRLRREIELNEARVRADGPLLQISCLDRGIGGPSSIINRGRASRRGWNEAPENEWTTCLLGGAGIGAIEVLRKGFL